MTNSIHDTITLLNIDDEAFSFEFNRAEGNPSYTIQPGQTVRYPRFLAEHALKHLTDRILNKRKQKTNNLELRNALAEQIIVGEEVLHGEPELTEADKLAKRLEEMNKSPLEAILAKRRKDKKKKVAEVIDEKNPAPVEEEKFDGLDEIKKDEEEVEQKAKPSIKVARPTKKELFEYAEKQNLVLDEKYKDGTTLRGKLDKMNIDEIVKELDYPLAE